MKIEENLVKCFLLFLFYYLFSLLHMLVNYTGSCFAYSLSRKAQDKIYVLCWYAKLIIELHIARKDSINSMNQSLDKNRTLNKSFIHDDALKDSSYFSKPVNLVSFLLTAKFLSNIARSLTFRVIVISKPPYSYCIQSLCNVSKLYSFRKRKTVKSLVDLEILSNLNP